LLATSIQGAYPTKGRTKSEMGVIMMRTSLNSGVHVFEIRPSDAAHEGSFLDVEKCVSHDSHENSRNERSEFPDEVERKFVLS
jgi:hypothetical protein